MPENPVRSPQRISPYLVYADAPAAIEFLCKAFGFEEEYRLAMDDGRIGHADLVYEGNVISLASLWPEMGFASPKDLPAVHCQLHCYVEDVDAHYAVARAAGATILAEPEEQPYGDKSYRAVDTEGHRWIFATRVRDVAPEDMEPPT